jgi:hypothetical protein
MILLGRMIPGVALLAATVFPALAADAPIPAAYDTAPTTSPALVDSGRLLATSGVSEIEGAAGGGLASWALITGYGTEDAIGASAHYTLVYLPDFTLQTFGAGIGLFDRVELSYARQRFDTGSTGAALGLGKGFVFRQDILGAKVKLLGDAVYDQDSWLPQIAAGTQYKINDQPAVIKAIGGQSRDGADFYLAATKLFLAQSLLVDATLRETKANQFGILGFGGDGNDSYTTQFEGSAALLLSRQLAIGIEYRTKPDNLRFAREQNAGDVFLAYFLNKHLSATLAYVDLGDIATKRNQKGAYLSIQAGF